MAWARATKACGRAATRLGRTKDANAHPSGGWRGHGRGCHAGRLYALSLADGSTVWTLRPNTAGFWASPAISQGSIYTVGLDGVLRTYAPSGS